MQRIKQTGTTMPSYKQTGSRNTAIGVLAIVASLSVFFNIIILIKEIKRSAVPTDRAKNKSEYIDDDQQVKDSSGVDESQEVDEPKQEECISSILGANEYSTNSTLDTSAKTVDGPRLFIHVGPVKTGSSSIQCNLQVNPCLKLSSYRFLGRAERVCPPTNFHRTGKFWNLQAFVFQYILRGWLGQTATNKHFEKYVNNFKATFRTNFEQGIHSIFSAEEFCGLLTLEEEDGRLLQLFADLLNDIPQAITFQVVHRYGFEWALSHYQFSETYGKQKLSSMEDKGMDSILDHKDVFLEHSPDHCGPYRMWSFLRRKLIPLLDRATIEVINFHGNDGDDIATRYICSLPGAEKACQKSREIVKLDRARPTNPDVLHSDRIVTAAWKEGLFANRSSSFANGRKEIREMIIDHVRHGLNSTFYDMPLECLSEKELTMSLDLSLCIGKHMLGDKFNASDAVSKLTRAKAKNKFCSVNVTALFSEDPSWSDFFRNIEI